MSNLIAARRYAEALYQEARAAGQVEAIDDDVEMIRATLEASRELVRLFESPVVSREKKRAVVDELFRERIDALTLRFLHLLIEKKRETMFPAVVEAYRALRDQQLGIVEAHARVAQPLSAEEEQEVVAALERMTGQRVRLQTTHEPGLLGGLVVRVGDTVYDGSVRHQLENLREQLEAGAALTN